MTVHRITSSDYMKVKAMAGGKAKPVDEVYVEIITAVDAACSIPELVKQAREIPAPRQFANRACRNISFESQWLRQYTLNVDLYQNAQIDTKLPWSLLFKTILQAYTVLNQQERTHG